MSEGGVVVAHLREWGVTRVDEQAGAVEQVFFPVPRELRAPR